MCSWCDGIGCYSNTDATKHTQCIDSGNIPHTTSIGCEIIPNVVHAGMTFLTILLYIGIASAASVVLCIVCCFMCQQKKNNKFRQMQMEAALVAQQNNQTPVFTAVQMQPAMVEQPAYVQLS
jgi:hypothetical protein